MLVKHIGAHHDFNDLWTAIRQNPVVSNYDLTDVMITNAVKLGRMSYALTGSQARGLILAGQDDGRYVIVFGEYGHMVIHKTPDDKLYFTKSPSYMFAEPKLLELEKEMDSMFTKVVLVGLTPSSLLQWYDTVYRRLTGRHTSPNFDPIKSAAKSLAAIAPGLACLRNMRMDKRTAPFMESL